MGEFRFTIGEELEGERLDKALAGLLDDVSRTYLQKQIEEGNVSLCGKPCKGKTILKCGDEIYLNLPEARVPDILPENIPLEILYEDEDVIVVNKPKDMVVHPAAGHYTGTLVNALLYYVEHHPGSSLSGINGVLRPGIVHRIDKDTTGSLIVCKNDYAHRSLAEQIGWHSVERKYRAIVHGVIEEDENRIFTDIGRDPKDRKKMAALPRGQGKPASTGYRVLERFDGYTYIECRLETGRTHQIRVHMASIGHPVLGDPLYSNRKCPFKLTGQTLHAMVLGFLQPHTHEFIRVEAPLPEYFEHLLEIMRKG